MAPKKEVQKGDSKEVGKDKEHPKENVPKPSGAAAATSKDAKKGSAKVAGTEKRKTEAPPPEPLPPPEDPRIAELKAESETQKTEITRLREVLSIIGSGEGDVREAKIIDLFKKNRYLNLALEKERNRSSKMANQIKVLQEELLVKANAELGLGLAIGDDAPGNPYLKTQEVVESWEDKYKKTLAKLQKVQAGKDMLQNEISKLHHVLRREVGEHVTLSKVLNENTNWRGRGEQISLLKEQLAECQKKIQSMEPTGEMRSSVFNDERRAVEMQHRNQLDAANYERRKELGNLSASYSILREHWEMTKTKLDKTTARKNILEADIRDAKAKVAVLVSKSENDDLLINALTLELAAARQALGPPYPRPGGPLQLEHHYRCNKIAATLSDLKYQCSQQEKEIKLQDEILGTVRATIADPDGGDWWTSHLQESSVASSEESKP